MGLTEEQLARRERGLGSSDVAAVCGLNPFRTPFDVWLTKRTPSRGPVGSGFTGNARTRMGDRLEPVILGFYAEEYLGGKRRTFPGRTMVGEQEWMLATPDLFVLNQDATKAALRGVKKGESLPALCDRLAEAKAVGSRMRRDWFPKDEELPEDYGKPILSVPVYVQAQVQWQMGVCKVPATDVVAYFGGTDDPVIEPVPFDPEAFGALWELCGKFWRDYIEGDTPPPATVSETIAERARKLFPQPRVEDLLVLADDSHLIGAVTTYLDARALLERVQKTADDHLGRLLMEIGEQEGLVGEHIGRVTWKLQPGKPRYKDMAEALYHEWIEQGPLPSDFIDQFRGAPVRVVNARGLKDPRATKGGTA